MGPQVAVSRSFQGESLRTLRTLMRPFSRMCEEVTLQITRFLKFLGRRGNRYNVSVVVVAAAAVVAETMCGELTQS